MSIVCDKGAISSLLAGIERLPLEYSLFEMIDNRHHSNSDSLAVATRDDLITVKPARLNTERCI